MRSDVYLIEVAGQPVGLVARDEGGKGYRFHAAVSRAFALDGELFKTPDQARDAARRVLDDGGRRRPGALDRAA